MENQNWQLKWELLVADVWADDELKQRLLSDPMAVCKERGIVPPEGVNLRVFENSEKLVNLVLPTQPDESELSEEALEAVAGGDGFGGCAGGVCGSPCVQGSCGRPRRPPQIGFGGCAGGVCGSPCIQQQPPPRRPSSGFGGCGGLAGCGGYGGFQ